MRFVMLIGLTVLLLNVHCQYASQLIQRVRKKERKQRCPLIRFLQ